MKTAMVILVHGSPTPGANDDVERVAQTVRQRGVFDDVAIGYLECNEPSIAGAIDESVRQRAGVVIAVPYFLHSGTHVAQDLPQLMREAAERHPSVEFRLAPFLGESPIVTRLLEQRAAAVMGA